MQNKKGISLIVLVITIIVMIILAAAIIISLNNTGIIGNANKAVKNTDDKQIREAIEVAKLNLNFEGSLNETTLKSELEKSLGEDVEVVKNKDNSYTIKVKNTYYTLEDDESIRQYDVWDKTSTDPTNGDSKEIHIYKASELKWLEEQVTSGNDFEGYTVYLENDLDFRAREAEGDTIEARWKTDSNKEYKWTPIAKIKEKPLKADFDGKNHVIKGIYVEETTKFNGIFGVVDATIKNLTIKNSYIEGGYDTGGITGAIFKNNAITNCHNINTTIVLIEGDNYNVGGIVGASNSDIVNCTNSGNIITYGTSSQYKTTQAGGIVGSISGANVKNCINKGEVKSNYAIIGGIAGNAGSRNVIMQDCINYGSVFAGKTDKDVSWCGGIAGAMSMNVTITSCANYGNINGTGTHVGGIVGVMAVTTDASQDPNNKIETCYNSGNVKGLWFVGGVVGLSSDSNDVIKYCYCKGVVTGENNVGSIIGILYENRGTAEHLYYLSNLKLKAIGDKDYEGKNVKSTTKNIDSFGEFKTWIAQFK